MRVRKIQDLKIGRHYKIKIMDGMFRGKLGIFAFEGQVDGGFGFLPINNKPLVKMMMKLGVKADEKAGWHVFEEDFWMGKYTTV